MTYNQQIKFNDVVTIHLRWADFKDICITQKLLPIQYITQSDSYCVFAIDDSISYICILVLADLSANFPFESDYSATQNDIDITDFISNYKSAANGQVTKRDSFNRQITITEPREGTETIYATHNLCDKVSWFGDSVRANETLTNVDGYLFTSSHINWIDMVSGRVLNDDDLCEEQKILEPGDPHGYKIIVKVDDVEKIARLPFETSDGDYEIFYDDGYVKFSEHQTGVVTASYSYENGSTFYVRPLPNNLLSIEAAEADFSDDIAQRDNIEYSVWGYVDVFAPQYLQSNGGPYPPGTKIPLKTGKYKRYNQILGEAIGAYPTLPPNGYLDEHKNLSIKEFRRQSRGSLRSMISVPFRYATTRDLDSRYGMELRIKLLNDKEFYGQNTSLTFYCTTKKIA